MSIIQSKYLPYSTYTNYYNKKHLYYYCFIRKNALT